MKHEVWRDSKGNVAYIKGIPQKIRGGLTNIEFAEAKDMKSGSVQRVDTGEIWYPPFTMTIEEYRSQESTSFDDFVNDMLNEKFGAPGTARRRKTVDGKLTSRDPNAWKDPLKKHHMKSDRPLTRKKPGWVPRTHQKDLALPMAQRILDIAKDADEGIWKISKAQSIALATKYRMHLPNDKTPAKRLGSTGIVMWRKTRGVEEPQMFLVKHEKLIRSGLSKKKKVRKLQSKKKKGREVFKGSFKSTYKAKKPKKPLGPTFEPGKVGT